MRRNDGVKRTLFLALFCCLLGADQASPKNLQERGHGKVRLVQSQTGAWTLLVDGKPYFVKGIEYGVDKVGTYPPLMNQWMQDDFDNNGKADGPYDSWVDDDGNSQQDFDEPAVGDFELLKQMGCNTIRLYHPDNIDKEILRDLYHTYNIRVIMGHFMGAYAIGSGASATEGTDYSDPKQQATMMREIQAMVQEHKDEPYVLFWMLGNENDFEGSQGNSTFNNTNARKMPETFAKFVNSVAEWIHANDPDHPVAVCNATTRLLKYYKQHAPAIDIIGMNAYVGSYGFGSLWNRVKQDVGRPVLITEFGADAYDQQKDAVDEQAQMRYHQGCWRDIAQNSSQGFGAGNSLGGVVYSWLDKWWLIGSPKVQETKEGAWAGAAPDGWYNDEWLGIAGQGDGSNSPTYRHLRAVYKAYRDMWVQNKLAQPEVIKRRGRPVE